MITIDGSAGEGGGQILRTSLALSLATGKPFRIEKIRAGREKPGLLRQHLTAVNAAIAVGHAGARGAELGSRELEFHPAAVAPGEYSFAVGTAGSTTLVLQTVLLPLLAAAGSSAGRRPSRITLEGGTHNPFAPPFDFLAKAFLPLLARMGARVTARLERHGFYPAGGGKFVVEIEPCERLAPFDLPHRGEILQRRARALVAGLPRHIAERELRVIGQKLSLEADCLEVEEPGEARGPGNIVLIEIASEHVTEVFTGFGERGVAAEKVARAAVDLAREYLAAGVPVGPHLADQLLVPLALAGGGSFRTLPLTRHSTTNRDVIQKFLDVEIAASPVGDKVWEVVVKGR